MQYERPSTAEEAADLLAQASAGGVVLAGGTDLIVKLRAGAARPALLVDIKGIEALQAVAWGEDGSLHLGAAVTMHRLAEEATLRQHFPGLSRAAEAVGSLQVRNRATLGGNLSHASPCMDTAPPLLVMGAQVHIVGANSERRVALVDFFLGPNETVLAPDELVTAVWVPPEARRLRTAFHKIKRIAGHDLALVNAAAAYDPEMATLQAAVGACGPTPVLTEALPTGPAGDPEACGQALAEAALAKISPIDDVRASAEYRRDMAATLSRRLAAEVMRRRSRGAS